jgi:hypothetical protein
MIPSFIQFHDLKPGDHALTDASSLLELKEHARILTDKLNPEMATSILGDVEGYGLGPSLNLLEKWTVVEHLAADLVAVDSVNLGRAAVKSFRYEPSEVDRINLNNEQLALLRDQAFLDYFKARLSSDEMADFASATAELSISITVIPPEVFTKCVDLLTKTTKAIKAACPTVEWGNLGFGVDKTYGELLADFYDYGWSLARSHLGVERTLVYYETAAAAGVPLILHPSRNDAAQAIDVACSDAYAAVKEIVRRTFEEPIKNRLESLGQIHSVALPPLASKMLWSAGREGISIIEAAARIKQSKNAQAFRKWLADIQINLAEGSMQGKLEALRMLEELKRVTSLWSTNLNTKEGVSHKRRELRLSWVPRIGCLLDLLDKPTLRDPILNRKGYLTFVSSWFDDQR